MQQLVHYFLHFVFPGVVAYLFYKSNWKKVYVIMLLTMLIDIDHLLANPVFDPCRCSIGFHPLHSYVAIGIYFFLLVPLKTRVVAIGLLIHIGTDAIDCLFSSQNCNTRPKSHITIVVG